MAAFGRWALLAPTVTLAAPVAAQDAPDLMQLRTRELLPILNGEGSPASSFTAKFLADVPEQRLREIAASVRAQLGRATGYRSLTIQGSHQAELVVDYERGTARGGIVIEQGTAGRISGFWIDAVEPADIAALRTLDEIAAQFAALPGKTGFVVAGLDGQAAAAHGSDRPLAIGSAFKLVILAELVRAIEAGERSWGDQITIGTRELPAGGFRGLAPGIPVALRKLAEEMIRVSDNSATDVLLHELGRERVETMQAAIGFRHAAANVPFLSTMELFKLKGVNGGALGRRYLAADMAGRRRLLAGEVARRTGADVGALFADGRPVMIESIEWFASPMDLVRAMGWFAERADRPPGAEALRILALNPGPAAGLRSRFGYVGYKGGSEPGVVNMTALVRNAAGRWTAVTASWNNPVAPVDELRFGALVTRALRIVSGP
jgi:beta-lactamase class A